MSGDSRRVCDVRRRESGKGCRPPEPAQWGHTIPLRHCGGPGENWRGCPRLRPELDPVLVGSVMVGAGALSSLSFPPPPGRENAPPPPPPPPVLPPRSPRGPVLL